MRSGAVRLGAGVVAATLAVWNAGCGSAERPPTTVSEADTADQTLFGMHEALSIDGMRRVEVRADTAYFFQTRHQADLHGVHVTFYDENGGETSEVTARAGTYDFRTQDMEARDDVVAVTPDGRRLTTSVLRYDRATNQISGPDPYVFTSATQHLEGDYFTSDPDFKNVATKHFRGNVGRVELKR